MLIHRDYLQRNGWNPTAKKKCFLVWDSQIDKCSGLDGVVHGVQDLRIIRWKVSLRRNIQYRSIELLDRYKIMKILQTTLIVALVVEWIQKRNAIFGNMTIKRSLLRSQSLWVVWFCYCMAPKSTLIICNLSIILLIII